METAYDVFMEIRGNHRFSKIAGYALFQKRGLVEGFQVTSPLILVEMGLDNVQPGNLGLCKSKWHNYPLQFGAKVFSICKKDRFWFQLQ